MTRKKEQELTELFEATCRTEISFPTEKSKWIMLNLIRENSCSWDVSLADGIDLVNYLCEEKNG